jgi:hypothetical protein
VETTSVRGDFLVVDAVPPNRSPTPKFPAKQGKVQEIPRFWARQDSSPRRISWNYRGSVFNSLGIRTANELYGTGNS